MPQAFRLGQPVEEILVCCGSLEKRALFRWAEFAGRITQEERFRIETVRLSH
jgi:hypothetical protein